MAIGIMQPYFFPYLGYFSLIKHTDRWIVFDTPQYIERGWVNRNRIIHPNQPEDAYITVPVAGVHRETAIKDVAIDAAQPYAERILGQLAASYKKRAPHYAAVSALVADCLAAETENLSRLNVLGMRRVCDYLGIPLSLEIFSEMRLELPAIHAPGDWALEICKALGETDYINPPGAPEIFDREKYAREGVGIHFLKIEFTPYEQKKPRFFEGLSVLDAMMFNTPAQVRDMLDRYELF